MESMKPTGTEMNCGNWKGTGNTLEFVRRNCGKMATKLRTRYEQNSERVGIQNAPA
jgi:hypothetical protein